MEADVVIDGHALARIDRRVEHKTHAAAARGWWGVGITGPGGEGGPAHGHHRRGDAGLIQLARQQVGKLDVVGRRQAVVARPTAGSS